MAARAEGQHGVISRAQLIALGLSAAAIDHWVRRGRLHPLYRGVYAVGHARVSVRGRWMAAVLRCGEAAVLSHRTAGGLWAVARHAGLIVVTAPRQIRATGLRVHCENVPPDERDTEDGIPVTTVARTLLDLAAVLPSYQLERAMNEAEVLGYADSPSLADLLARYPRRPGTRAIRNLLATESVGETRTRSELEARFLAFLDAAVLPRPRTNAAIEANGATYECDCVWPDERLIVELDGHAFHRTRQAFERDRAKDRALTAAGWRVIRVTWSQLHDEPEGLGRDLRAALRPRA